MGSVETSVNGLIVTKDTDGFELSKEGESTGTLIVETAEVIGMESEGEPTEESSTNEVPNENIVETEEDIVVAEEIDGSLAIPTSATFMDYINGGCEISFSVAIDFTGSNGDPRQPGTSHYLDPEGGRNDYEKAISAIGGVLAGYDSDKKIPVVRCSNSVLTYFCCPSFKHKSTLSTTKIKCFHQNKSGVLVPNTPDKYITASNADLMLRLMVSLAFLTPIRPLLHPAWS
jgi:hypothetical protein